MKQAAPASRDADPAARDRLAPMRGADLDAVLAIETRAYDFPWTRGNFIDSLAAGYVAERLLDGRGALLGYCIAAGGAGEMHLLNLTVAPELQGRGHARAMLDALAARCRAEGVAQLWLEVRASNARARALYVRYGFAEVGCRRGYYPARAGAHPYSREDAIVMSLDLGGGAA